MRSAVIVDVVRTASGKGKPGGALSHTHPVELLASLMSELLTRQDLDPALVDDVLIGCVGQVGEQSLNIGRHSVLAAGWPESVPATSIDRQCGSSQQAVHFGAQGIIAGAYDIVVVGGVESMSRVPMGGSRLGADAAGPSVARRYGQGLVNQGVAAELIADRWKLSREDLDVYAARSHERAVLAAPDGFTREIVALTVQQGDGDRVEHRVDETVRPTTTLEGLAGLATSFDVPEMRQRFPDLEWKITPGNSSPLTDGASAALLMGDDVAHRLGVEPRARVVDFAVAGADPVLMLSAPVPATQKLLSRSAILIDEIDAYEVNEAFASVPLMWQREFNADPARLNPRGGAIALGHPLGASGTRLLATLLCYLEDSGGRYGLQTMCEAGGMANATLIEAL